MTIPRLIGIGDELAGALPQLGQNLANLINPHQQEEDMLRVALMKNPELVDQLTAVEQTNPGATGIYGKRAQKFFSGNQLSPEFQEARKQTKLRTKEQEQDVARKEETLNRIKENAKIIAEIQRTDPDHFSDLMKTGAIRERFGIDPTDLEKSRLDLEDAKDRRKARDVAEGFIKGKSFAEIYDTVTSDAVGNSAEAVGAIMSHPRYEALKFYIQDRLEREREAARDARQERLLASQEARADARLRSQEARADARLKAAQDKEDAKAAERDQRIINGIDNQIKGFILGTVNRKQELTKEESQSIIPQLNSLLQRKAELLGVPMQQAIFAEKEGAWKRFMHGGRDKNSILIVDEFGNLSPIYHGKEVPPEGPKGTQEGQTQVPKTGAGPINPKIAKMQSNIASGNTGGMSVRDYVTGAVKANIITQEEADELLKNEQ